jgi:hypothetical protein
MKSKSHTNVDCVQVRCGGESIYLPLRSRDFHIFDNHHYWRAGWAYRKMFGMDFIRGLETAPRESIVLLSHKKSELKSLVDSLRVELDEQGDLLFWDYSYEFGREPGRRNGGAESGFQVRGLYGFITVRPAGYCDVRLSASRDGRCLFAELIDMRVVGRIETDNWGYLKVHRRRAELGWAQEIPRLLSFLETCPDLPVEIIHSHMP